MSRKTFQIALGVILASFAAVVISYSIRTHQQVGREQQAQSEIRLRLQWVPQAQFAGYLIAQKLGYYREEGLSVKILAAGPDIKPQNTVASGSDHVGIGVANQVIAARESGVPLRIIAQIFRDSANRYVLKAANRIEKLAELKGKKVGLWLGGDEAEFIAMAAKEGLLLEDFKIIPQEFSVIPFLEDQYVLSQVTTYNELIQLHEAGYPDEKLQVLAPSDYGADIVGDMIFTTEKLIEERREDLIRFLRASVRGWEYAFSKPEEAVDIIISYNAELSKPQQLAQLDAVRRLTGYRTNEKNSLGAMRRDDYVRASRVLLLSKQIGREPPVDEVFDPTLLEAAAVPTARAQ